MFLGYWRSNGKYTSVKEEDRVLLSEPPEHGDYMGVCREGICSVDFDDYSHKTNELDEPIHGRPRSEAIREYLDSHGYKYNAIKTEHGVHLNFKIPDYMVIDGNKGDWICALGVKLEVHVTKVTEPIVVCGNKRKFIKGDAHNVDIDPLPCGLFPIQKGREKHFRMVFESGDRNNHFSEYAFYLANIGFTTDQIQEIIHGMNRFILEDPLPESEIDLILRPETLEKLGEIEEQKKNGSVTPETFRKFLDSLGMSIRYNELLNVVEYENIPDLPEYQDITDRQNCMPIRLQYGFKEFTGKGNITKHQIIDLILLEADTHTYNPVKEFLSSTEWDGIDRFNDVFNILGVTDEYQKNFIRKWFFQTVGMAFNTMKNPIQAEGVLILQGAEGIGKTRFFSQLAIDPTWFSSLDKELTTKNKDILIQMLSVWIAEIGEIDRTFKANKSDVKSFITNRDDTIRKPYRMEQVKKARTTSFCGTTNKATFLNDETGSRRWWIIPVEKKIVLGDFGRRENLVQFWSQCYHEYINDPNCFRLTDDEMNVLKERNRDSMELLPSEEELRNRFDFDSPESEWIWTTASALKNTFDYDVGKYDVRQIGQALSVISKDEKRIKQKRTRSGNSWFIPPSITMTDRFRNK